VLLQPPRVVVRRSGAGRAVETSKRLCPRRFPPLLIRLLPLEFEKKLI